MKLIGVARLGQDAVVRHTPAGKAVANLSLAYNFGKKESDGKRPSQWVEASLWGDQAERLAPYLLKGTVLNVMCRDVHIESFESKGETRSKLVGMVADLEFVPKQLDREAPAKPAKQAPAGGFDDMDSDIPF